MIATEHKTMRVPRTLLRCIATVAALGFVLALAPSGGALAQKYKNDRPSYGDGPTRGGGNRGDGGHRGDGWRGPGWGGAVGIIMTLPEAGPPGGGRFIDDGTVDDGPKKPRRSTRSTARRNPSGAPPANERRLVPDEVVIELRNTVTPQQVNALQTRSRLERLEQTTSQLAGTTLYRWRIPDRRSVTAVVRELETENIVASAQPNYVYTLQQADAPAKAEGDPAQYELAKLQLPQAHKLAKGGRVLVAVIDSGIDATHPDLAGSIADSFNTLPTPAAPHSHGTAIAGLIAAHGKLAGAAPDAQILAVRAFDPASASAQATTFGILKGLDWAAAHGARVINMSFAGPADPAVHRSLEAATKRDIVLVAAAGNAGAKSPPLFPAAYPQVIAVSATDADDKLFEQSNRGRHIAVAAPGNQLLLLAPGGYTQASGTSFSAAEISGIVALMIERNNALTPAEVRVILTATAKDLGPRGKDTMFGAGLADAYRALTQEPVAPVAASAKQRLPIERVSTGAR
jgi:subtilisin family serine protease